MAKLIARRAPVFISDSGRSTSGYRKYRDRWG